jgi:hypothetical protein
MQRSAPGSLQFSNPMAEKPRGRCHGSYTCDPQKGVRPSFMASWLQSSQQHYIIQRKLRLCLSGLLRAGDSYSSSPVVISRTDVLYGLIMEGLVSDSLSCWDAFNQLSGNDGLVCSHLPCTSPSTARAFIPKIGRELGPPAHGCRVSLSLRRAGETNIQQVPTAS